MTAAYDGCLHFFSLKYINVEAFLCFCPNSRGYKLCDTPRICIRKWRLYCTSSLVNTIIILVSHSHKTINLLL